MANRPPDEWYDDTGDEPSGREAYAKVIEERVKKMEECMSRYVPDVRLDDRGFMEFYDGADTIYQKTDYIHAPNGDHNKVNCPKCHPDRVYRPHVCEWCGKWMAWDDQSCACMCKSNKGYTNG